MAAVLACGPPSPTHVTAPSERERPGIHVHRSRHTDATTHYGIRVTTPARTLVDLADVLPPKQLTRALNKAQIQRLITANELTTRLTRYPGRRTSQLTPERGATRSYAGFSTLRITDHRLKHHQANEARRFKEILSSRSPNPPQPRHQPE